MKTLNWNQSQILNEFSNCENLKELIMAIEEKCRKNSLLVCSILINGMSLEEEDENRFANTNMAEIKTVEIEVGNLQEIVTGVFNNYLQWMPYIKEVAEDAADSIRNGQMDLAQRSINELLDAFNDVVNSLIELKNTRSALPQLSGLEHIVQQEISLAGVLKQLLVAFESKDFVLAADIIEYDVNNSLDQLSLWVKSNLEEINLTWQTSNKVGDGEVSP